MSGWTGSRAIKRLTPEEHQALADRRGERRFPCNFSLGVAPFDGIHLPDRMDFVYMSSRDISKSGMSFFAPLPPETDELVLMLGSLPDVYYMTARVTRYQEGFWQRKRQFVIGCRFTGQVLYQD